MTQRTCSECPELSGRRATCSDRCRWWRRKRLAGMPCVDCGAVTGWIRGTKVAPVSPRCRECTKAPCGVVASYARGCRCVECRAAVAANFRAYTAKRRESGNPIRRKKNWVPPLRSGDCERCGERFHAREKETRYCGLTCAARANVARRRGTLSRDLIHIGPVVRPVRSTVAPVTVVRRTEWWAGFVYGPCTWCGDLFMAASTRFQDRYCSKRCGRRANSATHRARHGKFVVSARRRIALYERDGWMCQLCFESIDRDAHYLDSWAPSLDHIEPQTATLIPDHSDQNLQTAHMWCNAVRGDGTYHVDFFEVVA